MNTSVTINNPQKIIKFDDVPLERQSEILHSLGYDKEITEVLPFYLVLTERTIEEIREIIRRYRLPGEMITVHDFPAEEASNADALNLPRFFL